MLHHLHSTKPAYPRRIVSFCWLSPSDSRKIWWGFLTLRVAFHTCTSFGNALNLQSSLFTLYTGRSALSCGCGCGCKVYKSRVEQRRKKRKPQGSQNRAANLYTIKHLKFHKSNFDIFPMLYLPLVSGSFHRTLAAALLVTSVPAVPLEEAHFYVCYAVFSGLRFPPFFNKKKRFSTSVCSTQFQLYIFRGNRHDYWCCSSLISSYFRVGADSKKKRASEKGCWSAKFTSRD